MVPVVVKIKKIKENAVIPTYAKFGDAGCDLYSVEKMILAPGDRTLIHTGIVLEIPYGLEGQIRPRSGKAIKEGLTVINSPGTVDAGYRDEIRVGVINLSGIPVNISIGDRIAQLVICPVFKACFIEVNKLSDSDRGVGGFGHTGK